MAEKDSGVTVLRAWTQRGWSSCDHMIDDSSLEEIEGKHFPSVAHAMRAAKKRADDLGYAAIEYMRADGTRWLRGAEPNLPGRPRLDRPADPVRS